MGEEQTFAGLGSRVYFAPADNISPEPLQKQELKGFRVDLKTLDTEDSEKSDWAGNDGKGWAVTLTGRIDSPEGEKQAQRIWKMLTEGEGRLPRKEKKRRINRIVRNDRAFIGLVLLTMINPEQARNVAACLLFPECVGRVEGSNAAAACLKNPAQTRLVHLFTKRITKSNVKLLKKLWNRDYRRLAFEELLHDVEQLMKEIQTTD